MPTETVEAAVWEDLPPPVDLGGDDGAAAVPDDTEPEERICPVCEKPIIRDPSWARMHKYHDECRNRGYNSGSTSGGKTKRVGLGGKAEKEADRCEEILKGFLVKLALGVSVVDRYDAACIMMNTPAVCSSFRATCLRYADMRREFLRIPEGGSVLGLAFSVLLMAAPMAAHHGLIPGKRIAETLVQLPMMLYRLQERMSRGEAGMRELMEEQIAEIRRSREEAAAREKVRANGQYVAAS